MKTTTVKFRLVSHDGKAMHISPTEWQLSTDIRSSRLTKNVHPIVIKEDYGGSIIASPVWMSQFTVAIVKEEKTKTGCTPTKDNAHERLKLKELQTMLQNVNVDDGA